MYLIYDNRIMGTRFVVFKHLIRIYVYVLLWILKCTAQSELITKPFGVPSSSSSSLSSPLSFSCYFLASEFLHHKITALTQQYFHNINLIDYRHHVYLQTHTDVALFIRFLKSVRDFECFDFDVNASAIEEEDEN